MHSYNLELLKILVVDDSRHMQSIVKAILNAMRIKDVRSCDDPADAFVEMRHWKPDIIITDWKMDPLDGLDFVRLLRKGQDSPDPFVPIILLTGYAEFERVSEARDVGVTEILAKPISIAALHSRIVNIIEHPRPFIKAKHYLGPDRRRGQRAEKYEGPRRREDEADEDSDDDAA